MSARSEELACFVRESLTRQIPRAEIERALTEAGWHPHQVQKALAAYADASFPVPVPRPAAQLSAGEAFLYLIIFSALGAAAFSVVQLLFALVDWAFYDPAADTIYRGDWRSSLRWAVARVIIAFPLFLIASQRAARLVRRDPAERLSPVRRWLTYVAMFIAVCVVLGDLVTLVAYLLSGETTARFLLKVVIVGIIAGSILAHYLADIRDETPPPAAPASAPLLIFAFLTAALAVGGGLWLIGSPGSESARRTDQRRIEDLQAIATAIDLLWQRSERLPENLAALGDELSVPLDITDPETDASYEYRAESGRNYELCATFSRPSETVLRDAHWTHSAGRQCFSLAADPTEKRRP
jgi:hypothetical protein